MSFFARLTRLVLAQRMLVGILAVSLGLLSLAGGLRLVADFSVLSFFGGGDQEVEDLADYKELWGSDDSILLVVLTVEEGSILEARRLESLAALVKVLEADPDVRSTHSLVNAPILFGEESGLLDLASVADSIPAPGSGPGAIEQWRNRVLRNSAVVPFLVARDGKSTAVAVEMGVDADDVRTLGPLVTRLRQQAAPWNGRDGMWLGTAGIPSVRADFFELIFKDQRLSIPLVVLVIVLLLGLLFRRIHGVMAPGLAAAIPTVAVFGLMGWVGEPLGILNQSYATLLPAIAIADSIHLVSRFHEEARRIARPGQLLTREQRHEAIVRASSRIGLACLLTTATTGVGFLSLQMANMPILKGFGLYAALGIFTAYGTVLLILPVLLSFTRGTLPRQDPQAGRRMDAFLRTCARASTRHPVLVLVAVVAVVLASIGFGSRVVVDNALTGLLRDEHPTSRANAVIDQNLGGMLGIEVESRGKTDAHKEPQVVQALAGLEAWAWEQPEVRSVQGPASMLSLFTEVLRGREGLPQTRPAIAQTMFLGEGAGLERFLDLFGQAPGAGHPEGIGAYARARTVIRTEDLGGHWLEGFSSRLQEEIDRRFEDLPVEVHITGTPFVAYRGINRVTTDLRNSLILAFGIITALIFLLFRSPRIALLCLVPNALPLVVGYGLMGAAGWILDPTPAVVFTVALGIAVDDTIHLVVRWREERLAAPDNSTAIEQAVIHTGRAVTITTIVLMAGFLANGFSSFPTMVVLALLGASVIFVALLCDLFVLPALLMLWGEPGPRSPTKAGVLR
ncbi:MAG: MMPL family transporter [Myxococcota bacterium]|nr:MMPL family transporter [Myxococcota bacterium]